MIRENVASTCFASIYDPEIVQLAFSAGVGKYIREIWVGKRIHRMDNPCRLRHMLSHVQKPRVITVDKNLSYPAAIEILKKDK